MRDNHPTSTCHPGTYPQHANHRARTGWHHRCGTAAAAFDLDRALFASVRPVPNVRPGFPPGGRPASPPRSVYNSGRRVCFDTLISDPAGDPPLAATRSPMISHTPWKAVRELAPLAPPAQTLEGGSGVKGHVTPAHTVETCTSSQPLIYHHTQGEHVIVGSPRQCPPHQHSYPHQHCDARHARLSKRLNCFPSVMSPARDGIRNVNDLAPKDPH